MINIAIMGHGVVGSGVAEVLDKNRASIERRAGDTIQIRHIFDRKGFPDSPYADCFTQDFKDILQDDTVSIVVETMGGLHPAYDYVKACLEAGKSVVSSNKELVAAKGAELLALAAEKNVNFLFEASVGGGIPIIRPLHQCLGANEITEIAGILNGTTNFILTKMIREGSTFADALALAQQLGYAERDPSADVEGIDACRKICILASLAFGNHIYPDGVHAEGITAITPEDVSYAADWGGVIKLIGRAKPTGDGKVMVMVSPCLIPSDSQLAGVDDVFNGIMVRGNATGDVVFYGKGAGKLPTASAVTADIIDAIKAGGTISTLRWRDSSQSLLADYRQQQLSMYIRVQGEMARSLAEQFFGIIKPLFREGCPANEFAFITPVLTEAEIDLRLQQLEDAGLTVLGRIRVADL